MRNAVRPQLPGVGLCPLARGRRLRLRMSVFQTQANLFSNSLKQTWPWGSKSRMKGITAGRGLAWGNNSKLSEDTTAAAVYRHRTSVSNDATAGMFWARLEYESSPTLLPPSRRHCTCNSVQRKILASPSPGTSREGGNSSG